MNFTEAKRIVFYFVAALFLILNPLNASAQDGGYDVFSGLWLKSVLRTSAGSFTLIWKEVGRDITPSGDKVISGYFYADPARFAYGSQYNPEIFVKIYVASNGWANIAFNHVTVDNVDVYSAHHYNGTAQQSGTVTLYSRLEEHSYTGVSTYADFTPPFSAADASPYQDGGYILFWDLWAKSVLRTSAGFFILKWKEVGNDTTPSGDKVISGYFYADPDVFSYGSEYNPELFVKVYVASNGWANIAFNHVTVAPVDVYSAHIYNGRPNYTDTATLARRLTEHSYTGVSRPTLVCGDGICDPFEPTLCPSDCGSASVCGNGICETGETQTSCPSDCRPAYVCGNGSCETGETQTSCPSDCRPASVCGNGSCETGETQTSCPSDCGSASVCGNGSCETGETQ
ncbi:MAG: hypothetical protein V2I97_13770, partial [Desulfococcaceae bacterium]|nr:hypothetical protein [Desulfococcaceae bacterium]